MDKPVVRLSPHRSSNPDKAVFLLIHQQVLRHCVLFTSRRPACPAPLLVALSCILLDPHDLLTSPEPPLQQRFPAPFQPVRIARPDPEEDESRITADEPYGHRDDLWPCVLLGRPDENDVEYVWGEERGQRAGRFGTRVQGDV